MGFGNVGQKWTPASFATYVNSLSITRPWKGVTIHHTADPSLASRPTGFTVQHIRNIQHFYQYQKSPGWSSGPHLFTDENEVFGMCPLNERGIHAVSFNATYLGIEMLGDYDVEDPTTGRGKQVIDTSVAATVTLLRKLGLPANATTVNFHRDDTTTRKSCPGRRIQKAWFLGLVQAAMAGGAAPSPTPIPVTVLPIGPAVVLPDGTRFGTNPGETEEQGGRTVVAAYSFGDRKSVV